MYMLFRLFNIIIEARYVVHYFNHFGQGQKHSHGEIIPLDRFQAYPSSKPDDKLLLWQPNYLAEIGAVVTL